MNVLNAADLQTLWTGDDGSFSVPASISRDPYQIAFPDSTLVPIVVKAGDPGESIGLVTGAEAGGANFELQRMVYGNQPNDVYDTDTEIWFIVKKNAETAASVTAHYSIAPEGSDQGFEIRDEGGAGIEALVGTADFDAEAGSVRYVPVKLAFTRAVSNPGGYDLRSMRLEVREGDETGPILAEDSCSFRVNAVKRTIYVTYDPYSSGGGTHYPYFSVMTPDREIYAKSAIACALSGMTFNPGVNPPYDVPERGEPCFVVVTNKFQDTLCAVASSDIYTAYNSIPAGSPIPPTNSAAEPVEIPYGQGYAFTIGTGEKHYFRVYTRPLP
jgi:hypothetical protein